MLLTKSSNRSVFKKLGSSAGGINSGQIPNALGSLLGGADGQIDQNSSAGGLYALELALYLTYVKGATAFTDNRTEINKLIGTGSFAE